MSLFEVGRVCIKKAGRETGKKCVVVDVIDKNYVLITGPKELTGVKRRRVNVDHIEPLETKLSIKKGMDDKEVAKTLKKAFPGEFPPEKKEPEREKAEMKIEKAEKPVKKRTAKKKRLKKEEEKSE